MKNLQYFFAFVISFFFGCYDAYTTENREEALRQSAISALREGNLAFTDDQGMNYTLKTAVPLENFKNAITEGWHLTLLHSRDSTSSFHSTSTRTTSGGAPSVSESSSGPRFSEGSVYSIEDKSHLYIGTLLACSAGTPLPADFFKQYAQGLLSGAQGLEMGTAHAPTPAQKEEMLRRAQDMKKAAETMDK